MHRILLLPVVGKLIKQVQILKELDGHPNIVTLPVAQVERAMQSRHLPLWLSMFECRHGAFLSDEGTATNGGTRHGLSFFEANSTQLR